MLKLKKLSPGGALATALAGPLIAPAPAPAYWRY